MKLLDMVNIFKPRGYSKPLEIFKRSLVMDLMSFSDMRGDHKYGADDFFSFTIQYRLSDVNYSQRYVERVSKNCSLYTLNKEMSNIVNSLKLKHQNGIPFSISVFLHKNEMYQKINGDLLDIEVSIIKGSYDYKLNDLAIKSVSEFNNKYDIYNQKNRYEVAYQIFGLAREMWTFRINDGSLTIKEIHDEFQKINRKRIVQVLLKEK